MGRNRSRTPDAAVKAEAGVVLALRWGLTFVALVVAAWGVVVSLVLLAAVVQGYCGPDRACGGRGHLVLGPWGVVAGLLIEERARRMTRLTGPPVMTVVFEALCAGAVPVVARPVFTPEAPLPWRVLMGLLTLLAAGLTGWMVRETVRIGLKESVRRQFWLRDVRGTGKSRTYVYPQTRQERAHARALLLHILLGLGTGTVLGLLYV